MDKKKHWESRGSQSCWNGEDRMTVWSNASLRSRSRPKHGLPFEFSVREPPGPKSAKWAPLSLSALPQNLHRPVAPPGWIEMCARHLAVARHFSTKFHHSGYITRAHARFVPHCWNEIQLKFLLKLWHALMNIAIMLHQIVLIILLYIRGHNFMVIPDLITLHHISATAFPKSWTDAQKCF